MTRKEAKRARLAKKYTPEQLKERARIKRLIRKGELPQFHFVKDENGNLPRGHKINFHRTRRNMMLNLKSDKGPKIETKGLRLINISTLELLMKLES